MKSGIRLSVTLVALFTLSASCKDDEGTSADLAVRDLAGGADLSATFVGIACGPQTCNTGSICCSDGNGGGATCETSCTKSFNFKCDGPEDCTGADQVCCLTINNPGMPATHKFTGECRAKSACDPTLSATANPIVTARCHDNPNCEAFHPILSQCCYNADRPNLTFCAIPFSNDGGISVICPN